MCHLNGGLIDSLPIDTSDAHDSVVNGDPPVEALVSIASVVHALSSVARAVNDSSAQSNQPSDAFMLEAPECLYGRVVNVAVWEGPHWDLVSLVVRIGTFIRLRNVEDKTMGSGFRCECFWQLCIHHPCIILPHISFFVLCFELSILDVGQRYHGS